MCCALPYGHFRGRALGKFQGPCFSGVLWGLCFTLGMFQGRA